LWNSGVAGKLVIFLIAFVESVPLLVGLAFIWVSWFDYLPRTVSVTERVTVLGFIVAAVNGAFLWFELFLKHTLAFVFISRKSR